MLQGQEFETVTLLPVRTIFVMTSYSEEITGVSRIMGRIFKKNAPPF